MAGMIALVGGDEFRAGCEEMDRALLEATGAHGPTLLVVPTAAAHQNPSKAASNGVDYFTDLGAKASPLMVLQPSDANDDGLLSPIDDADVVYLTGGDPAHLLDVLEGSLMLDKLTQAMDRGALLAGSSAGAMVMGSWMRYRGWRQALGIVPNVVTLPHHEGSDPASVSRDLATSAPRDTVVLGIDARTCCFLGPDGSSVLGHGSVTLYQHGQWRQFQAGKSLPLTAEGLLTPP